MNKYVYQKHNGSLDFEHFLEKNPKAIQSIGNAFAVIMGNIWVI